MRPRPACRHLESSQTATLDARSGWQPCLRAGGPDESASIADIEGVDPSKAAKFCMNVCISWAGLSRLTRCGHGHTLGGLWLGVLLGLRSCHQRPREEMACGFALHLLLDALLLTTPRATRLCPVPALVLASPSLPAPAWGRSTKHRTSSHLLSFDASYMGNQ